VLFRDIPFILNITVHPEHNPEHNPEHKKSGLGYLP